MLYSNLFILITAAGVPVKKVVIPAFTVTPTEITLRPRTATAFTFKGNFPTPALLKEMFVLESKIGAYGYKSACVRVVFYEQDVIQTLLYNTIHAHSHLSPLLSHLFI
jgi:hypothetical protein